MSGLCETCIDPGHCCRDLHLTGGSVVDPTDRADVPMSFEAAEHFAMRSRLPFRPFRQHEDGTWRWWCTALGPDGRCTVYETRPQLCRDYRAGSDGLCVHYWPDSAGGLAVADA